VKVLTDEVELKPFLDFDRYSETIIRMIKGSEPNFSIGIYGEWGTGKTTLMKSIEQSLRSEKDILTVWFNAWRYEREEQFALISLMKTIAYKMDEQPKYEKAKQVLFKSIVTVGKGLASKYVFSDKYIDEIQQNFDSDMKVLAKADKDTIYFHGLKQIEDTMSKIIEDSPSRIVVFIDDLDRCSPKKALEVFESIKVFLGIKGFIYIIGLSHETIGKLITAEYEKSGIKGDQYIKKIIQIPIMVPEWNSFDIGNLIENVLLNKLDERYSKIIKDNKDLIAIASEANPREVKRFINNFIVSNEIFSINSEVHPQQLLAIQALKVRWLNFYHEITSSGDDEFRNALKEYADMNYRDRLLKLRELKSKQQDEKNANREFEKRLLDIEPELWKFLDNAKEIIFEIKNWEIYRRAAESTKSDLTAPTVSESVPTELRDNLWKLLIQGKVNEFNRMRQRYKHINLNLSATGVDKGSINRGLDLRGINLSGINLRGQSFNGCDLSGADLKNASLFDASLDSTNLTGADLTGADLTGAYMDRANLNHAKLNETDITGVLYLPIRISEARARGAKYFNPPLYSQE
jgi:hypothetical protein